MWRREHSSLSQHSCGDGKTQGNEGAVGHACSLRPVRNAPSEAGVMLGVRDVETSQPAFAFVLVIPPRAIALRHTCVVVLDSHALFVGGRGACATTGTTPDNASAAI